jgi:acetyltransferase-like isoleucine patch superfamily enzyme
VSRDAWFRNTLRALVRWRARRRARADWFYLRLCRPSGREYAELLRRSGALHAMGEDCAVQPHAVITDPSLVRMGRNVRLAGCKLIGHDGSVNMINRAYGLTLDSVGGIDIGDNVFIGENAIVLGPVRIGSDVIVAAGALVVKDVESGWVVGGVPARPICRTEEHVARLARRNAAWPWMQLIEQRNAEYDPAIEGTLMRMRADYFFGSNSALPELQ